MKDSVDQPSHRHRWWLNTVRKRYGWAMLVCLLGWTSVITLRPLEALLDNALLLDSYMQLVTLTIVNSIAVVFCLGIVRLLNQRYPTDDLLGRLGNGSTVWTPKLFWVAGVIAVVTPLVLACTSRAEFPLTTFWHVSLSIVVVIFAVGLAWAFLVTLGRVKSLLFGNSVDAEKFLPFESTAGEGSLLEKGWVGKIGQLIAWANTKIGLEQIDLLFSGYLALLAVVHWLSVRFMSASEVWLTSTPLLVVLLIWLVFMLLAGAANLLDRFRLPVVPLLLLAITIWQIPRGSTMPLRTQPDISDTQFNKLLSEVRANEPKDFHNSGAGDEFFKPIEQLNAIACRAIDRRLKRMEDNRTARVEKEANEEDRTTLMDAAETRGRTLVVVTCPGGGIHAAAWASCVLDSISYEYSDFADSICVISGVSGGSVGSLYFASTRYHHRIMEDEDSAFSTSYSSKLLDELDNALSDDLLSEVYRRTPALHLASQSALEPIAYGLMTDDLYGAIWSGLAFNNRGQRLEDVFHNNLPDGQQGKTFGRWGKVAADGKMPIVVFNSTDAATGRRVLFDTIPSPRRIGNVGQKSRPLNYRELLGESKEGYRDVTPAAAARASATFPYVSPFSRPDVASTVGNTVALCDGGYVDNEGIVTAVNWIQFCLKRAASATASEDVEQGEGGDPAIEFDRILLIRIEPSPNVKEEADKKEGLGSWLRWLTGPLEAVVNVRATSQSERGNLESDLAYTSAENSWQASRQSTSEPQLSSVANAFLGIDPVQSKRLVQYTSLKGKSEIKTDSSKLDEPEPFEAKDENTDDTEPEIAASKKQLRQQWDDKVRELRRMIEANKRGPKESDIPGKTETFNDTFMEGYTQTATGAPGSQSVESLAILPDERLVVVQVRFPDFDQAVPLNWKLSTLQKFWYPLAWKECSRKDSELRRTLDTYFTPARNPGHSGVTSE